MPQPPTMTTVAAVLDRCVVIHGEDTAETLADWLVADMSAAADQGPQQALYAAAWQLVRARQLRAGGNPGLANMVDHIAEACIGGWRDELTVRTTTVEETT